MSSCSWVQRPMPDNKDTNGLVVTTSFPQWVGDLFIHHQWIPSQTWGHFLPGKKVLTSLLKPPEWWFKGWPQTTTALCYQTRPLGSCHFFLSPPRDARKCDLFQGCWMDWWAHESCNLSHVCQFTLKDCSPCHSDTGSEWMQGGKLPRYLQATKGRLP